MTKAMGFAYGIIAGVIAAIIFISPTFTGTTLRGFTWFIGGAFVILSFAITYITSMRRKSVFGPIGDGFISGFTGLFGVLSIIIALSAGQWPSVFG